MSFLVVHAQQNKLPPMPAGWLEVENTRVDTESFSKTDFLFDSEHALKGACTSSKDNVTIEEGSLPLDTVQGGFLNTVQGGSPDLPFPTNMAPPI